jgi:hypothetical protein
VMKTLCFHLTMLGGAASRVYASPHPSHRCAASRPCDLAGGPAARASSGLRVARYMEWCLGGAVGGCVAAQVAHRHSPLSLSTGGLGSSVKCNDYVTRPFASGNYRRGSFSTPVCRVAGRGEHPLCHSIELHPKIFSQKFGKYRNTPKSKSASQSASAFFYLTCITG